LAWRSAVLAAILLAAAGPEPQDTGPGASPGPVPSTLEGATVVHTAAVSALLNTPGMVILDVSEAPRRPQGLAPGAPWLPLRHRDIPGSVWIPGVGRKDIPADLEAYYRSRLAELTGASRDHAILIYCHPNCLGSWIAANRALGYGYRNVSWYPEGIEGWEDAGLPTAPADPEGPDIRLDHKERVETKK
jgi:PQQ-dependent catabolism-associated CXXCW motif protein